MLEFQNKIYGTFSKRTIKEVNSQNTQKQIEEKLLPENINKLLGQGDLSALEDLEKHHIPYTKMEQNGEITIKYEYEGIKYIVKCYLPEDKEYLTQPVQDQVLSFNEQSVNTADREFVTINVNTPILNVSTQTIEKPRKEFNEEPLSLNEIANNCSVMNPRYEISNDGGLVFEDDVAAAVYERIQLDLKEFADEKEIEQLVADAWIQAFSTFKSDSSVDTGNFIQTILRNILSATNSEDIKNKILAFFENISFNEQNI